MAEFTTSPQGYAVIRSFEGKSNKAYRDEVGVWTIGYGNTNYDAEVLGFEIKAGVVISDEQVESLLRAAITRRYEPACRKAMGPDCNQPSFDAAGSFHYNTGAIARASWVKSFVAKNLTALHSQLMQWNKAGGAVLAGLTRRRNREWEMISQGDYGPEGRSAPTDMATGKPVVATGNHPTYPGMMRAGDKGPEVKDFKAKLVEAGYKLTVDESFDAATAMAVKDLQAHHPQLRVDGVAGPATRTAVQRDLDARSQIMKTTGGGLGTTVATTAVDSVSNGALPTSVYVVIGIGFACALAYVAWNYRDELVAMFKSKFN